MRIFLIRRWKINHTSSTSSSFQTYIFSSKIYMPRFCENVHSKHRLFNSKKKLQNTFIPLVRLYWYTLCATNESWVFSRNVISFPWDRNLRKWEFEKLVNVETAPRFTYSTQTLHKVERKKKKICNSFRKIGSLHNGKNNIFLLLFFFIFFFFTPFILLKTLSYI